VRPALAAIMPMEWKPMLTRTAALIAACAFVGSAHAAERTPSEWRTLLPVERFVCEKPGGERMSVTIDPTSLTMIVDGVGFAISTWEVRAQRNTDEFGYAASPTFYWNAFVAKGPLPGAGTMAEELLAQTPNIHYSIFRYATGWGLFIGAEMSTYRCLER
jgi:hypothetical protein